MESDCNVFMIKGVIGVVEFHSGTEEIANRGLIGRVLWRKSGTIAIYYIMDMLMLD